MNHYGDAVTCFQRGGAPASAEQLDGRAHLHAPFHIAVLARHEHLDPAVRVGPLERLDGARESYGLIIVEHRAGVMGCHWQCQAQRDDAAEKLSTCLQNARSPVAFRRESLGWSGG